MPDSTDDELKQSYAIYVKVGGDPDGIPEAAVFGIFEKVYAEVMARTA